jgi:hypothetical protein
MEELREGLFASTDSCGAAELQFDKIGPVVDKWHKYQGWTVEEAKLAASKSWYVRRKVC